MGIESIVELIQYRITPMDSEHKDININRTFHRDDYKSLKVIIEALKRGEKYEKMWGKIQETEYPSDIDFSRIKQKYFPKE